MQPFNHFQEDFEQIILQKEFHQLNAAELKNLGAENMSEEEYNHIRRMLLSLNELDEESEQPSAALKQKLLDVFDEGKEKKGIIIRWPIIAGITLAAAAMIALGIFLFHPDSDHFELKNEVSQEISLKKEKELDIPSVTDTIKTVTNNSGNETLVKTDEVAVSNDEAPLENSSFEPIKKLELAEAPVEAKEEVEMKDVSAKAPVATEANATLSSGSTVTLSSAHYGNSYNWDSNVSNSTKELAVLEKSKSKKEKQQQSLSLADFPQVISNTVTVY